MTLTTPIAAPGPAMHEQKLRMLAEKLESQFLAEMLKSAGVGKPREGFGGGAGEDQFSGFLTHEYATAIVEAGGIGMAEAVFSALVRKESVQ